ncbi:MAG: radical SAM family heme chaperone HemW [Armatimonadetes bacterium]|nr:radical SAM family heme chaperone HemW [Armatimonadota bacterium]
MTGSGPVAVYVHVPFCPSKCGYCDFNSYAMHGDIVPRTVQAMLNQIRTSPWKGRPAKTVFFGGGTPTFLDSGTLTALLDAVLETHPPSDGCEVTSEANPGTVDRAKLRSMKAAGFNRLSLGAQSFDTGDLIRLGRVHGPTETGAAVDMARCAGFDRINLDLMFGLPGQRLSAWRHNLQTAIRLVPGHLSLYGLTIEPNTRFYRLHLKGMLDLPDDDAQVRMYQDAIDACAEAGLAQYEVSNFAKPGEECRHNLCYWRGEEYLGYGPGAVGCAIEEDGAKRRRTNVKHPERYSAAVESGSPGYTDVETLDSDAQRLERIMLGIRLNEGIDARMADLDEAACQRLVQKGWLETSGSTVRLTPQGRLFCTDVSVELA